jgi:hypothetical protein
MEIEKYILQVQKVGFRVLFNFASKAEKLLWSPLSFPSAVA